MPACSLLSIFLKEVQESFELSLEEASIDNFVAAKAVARFLSLFVGDGMGLFQLGFVQLGHAGAADKSGSTGVKILSLFRQDIFAYVD